MFPDWFRRLSYRTFAPERPKPYGCATKRTRFTPAVNGGTLSLFKGSRALPLDPAGVPARLARPIRATRRSQYPCPCNTGWGDGTTNPTPAACEPAHRGRSKISDFRDDENLRFSNHRKGRQADGTARVRPRSNCGRSSDAVSGAVQGDTVSLSGRRIRHTPRGGSRTEHEPEYAHAAESCHRWCRDRPTPSAWKPRRLRRGGCHR